MTDEALAGIEAKARAATPGPRFNWTGGPDAETFDVSTMGVGNVGSGPVLGWFYENADAEFAAALGPNEALALVEEVWKLRAEVEWLKQREGEGET